MLQTYQITNEFMSIKSDVHSRQVRYSTSSPNTFSVWRQQRCRRESYPLLFATLQPRLAFSIPHPQCSQNDPISDLQPAMPLSRRSADPYPVMQPIRQSPGSTPLWPLSTRCPGAGDTDRTMVFLEAVRGNGRAAVRRIRSATACRGGPRRPPGNSILRFLPRAHTSQERGRCRRRGARAAGHWLGGERSKRAVGSLTASKSPPVGR